MQKKKVRKNREQWDEQLLGAGMILFAVIVSMVSLLGKAPVFGENKEETKNQAVKIEVPKERIEVITKETDKKTAKSMLYEGAVGKLEKDNEEEPLVMLDPGHGGVDGGCVKDGIKEKNINFRIALLAKGKLEEKGFRVLLTREKDAYISKEDRAKFANRIGADAFVSIHQNTFEDASVFGLETWYDGKDAEGESQRLACLVHGQTLLSTGAEERELHGDADFHVTSSTQMPSCLIETGFLSNREERDNLKDAQYQEKIAEGIAQGIDLYFHPKTMYLTFDDGPSEECTDMVLNILREKNVKATFFLIGEYVEKYPEVARRIVEEGHTVGIHCYRHDYSVLYESVDSYLEDFQKAYDVVEKITGVKAKIFRFPGGSVNAYNKSVCEDIIREMTCRGYVYFDWNASLDDAAGAESPEELLANAKATAMGRKKVVMLAHDRVYNTALCLDSLILQFPEYRMEVLTTDVEQVKFALP